MDAEASHQRGVRRALLRASPYLAGHNYGACLDNGLGPAGVPVPGQNPIGGSALADGGRVGRARWHLSR